MTAPTIAPGTTKVGWIGTGVMGASMVGHLIDAGFSATVYTRTKSKADALVAKGAAWAESPKAVAEAADVVFSIVGFPNDVREVMLGENGALAGSKAGNVLVDMTTSDPSLAIEIARNGGAAIVSFSMSPDDVRHVMQIPWVATASDGRAYLPGADRPHPRSYGTFARKIGHYSIRENVLPLSVAIRSATSLPAEILGMTDRGFLRKETYADVVVFDPAKIQDHATYAEPHRYATGMKHVFVNGVHVLKDGEHTGATPGRFVHGPGWKGPKRQ